MESTIKESHANDPETELVDGEYYYAKALNYLAVSSSEHGHSDGDGCSCSSAHCPSSPTDDKDDDDDDHFTLGGYRRGLTREHEEAQSSGSSNSSSSSPRSSDGGVGGGGGGGGGSNNHHVCNASALPPSPPPARKRERKLSVGGRFYQTGTTGSEFGKVEPRRKMSDGHVHWADEFQKELTRCHPRKSYSRHPSHLSSQMKPILKLSHGEGEEH